MDTGSDVHSVEPDSLVVTANALIAGAKETENFD